MNIASIIPGLGWTESIFGKKKSFYQLAKGKTLAIPMDMHKANRYKVCDIMKSKGKDGIILLKGGEDSTMYDTDAEVLFKQDSWFNYLFGAKESGCYATIEISTYKTTLFIPRLSPEYEIWCGKIHPPSYFKDLYDVDEVEYVEDIVAYFNKVLSKPSSDVKIFLLEGVNSDSGSKAKPATFENDSIFDSYKDTTSLFHCLSTARVTKSEHEISTMRYCALVASNAHVEVMRTAKEGMYEYELEAKFLYEIYRNGGCRRAAYNSICACGPNGAILHYGHANAPNDRKLLISDMALLDMGAEYHGYVSDITCSFPIAGTFTEDQKVIYQSVLNAQRAVLEMMKPGIEWPQCHIAAEKEILKGLANAGILVNGTVENFVESNLGATFFPHGLGHLIGCDTHDVGGYIEGTPARSSRPGLNKLRTARVLEEGMVLTNEPGCYFIGALLDKAIENPTTSKYINVDVLERFRCFGGVRLEDVVRVTSTGVENLTLCPRSIEEIESVMAGAEWPPSIDTLPVLKRKWCKLADDGTIQDIVIAKY